jgi:hypothetical protein
MSLPRDLSTTSADDIQALVAGHGKHVTKKGGISIVTYEKNGAGYTFSGLV